jgi:hypothetical protein
MVLKDGDTVTLGGPGEDLCHAGAYAWRALMIFPVFDHGVSHMAG